MAKTENREKGLAGEALAALVLQKKGYRVLHRNWRCKLGEIDIIAADGDAIVFIEVKARGSAAYGRPQEAVTVFKQRQIIKAALSYIKSRGLTSRDIRFDVVSVCGQEVELIRNAFQSEGRYRY
jgi:putative endonuclease